MEFYLDNKIGSQRIRVYLDGERVGMLDISREMAMRPDWPQVAEKDDYGNTANAINWGFTALLASLAA